MKQRQNNIVNQSVVCKLVVVSMPAVLYVCVKAKQEEKQTKRWMMMETTHCM